MTSKIETLYWSSRESNESQESPLPSEFKSNWRKFCGGSLQLIDQTLLPMELRVIDCRTIETVWEAIKMLRVRGAPAIGIAAAYGVCLGLQSLFVDKKTASDASEPPLDFPHVEPDETTFFQRLDEATAYLASSRPTAVNLFWALDRMKNVALSLRGKVSVSSIAQKLLETACEIHEEDRVLCRTMGRFGASLVRDGDTLLTHCNAGGLATADYGTALAVFFWAFEEEGKKIRVYADETRPLLQGARLTAWELRDHGIDVVLICDSMAAMVMKQKKIDAVFVGADRIAANGDTANKIGTYSLALVAKAHHVPFYVVAPRSTFDLTLQSGEEIPIEERNPEEIRRGFGKQTAPDHISIYNPAFDVTPAALISAIITEKGIISPVTPEKIDEILRGGSPCERE